jgi:hypothetical protein
MGWGLIIQRRSHFPSGGWPECSGIGGRNESEWPAGMDRNGWPESIGISGRNASEYAGISRIPGVTLGVEMSTIMK